MGCNHPFKGFWTGNYTEKGKKELVIMTSTSGDLLPLSVADSRGFRISPNAPLVDIDGKGFISDPIPIPCGHCSGCRMANAKQWKVRCVLESQEWKYTYFVTLTYADECLPFIDGEAVLNIDDLQKFWKRLRKCMDFRYFACGEYGENYARPHYHALIFTNTALKGKLLAVNHFRSPLIERVWNLGITEYSIADSASIAYCCGYVEKKQSDPLWNNYKVKPFRVMSRKPGLGASYLAKHSILDTGKVYGNFGSHSYSSVPHYLLSLVEKDRCIDEYKESMQTKGKEYQKKLDCVYDESDPDKRGFLQDKSIDKLLDRKRKEKLC